MNLKLKNFIIRIIEIKAETVFQAAICTEKFNFRSKTIFFGIISNRNLDRDVGSLVSKKKSYIQIEFRETNFFQRLPILGNEVVLGVFGYGESNGTKILDDFPGNFEVRISWEARFQKAVLFTKTKVFYGKNDCVEFK